MIVSKRKRGTTLLYVVGITVIAVGLSSVAVRRSLECYRVSAMQEYRLQAQNALEGALVVLNGSPDGDHEKETVGASEVVFGDAVEENDQLVVPVTVTVVKDSGVVYTLRRNASYKKSLETWKFAGFVKGDGS